MYLSSSLQFTFNQTLLGTIAVSPFFIFRSKTLSLFCTSGAPFATSPRPPRRSTSAWQSIPLSLHSCHTVFHWRACLWAFRYSHGYFKTVLLSFSLLFVETRFIASHRRIFSFILLLLKDAMNRVSTSDNAKNNYDALLLFRLLSSIREALIMRCSQANTS